MQPTNTAIVCRRVTDGVRGVRQAGAAAAATKPAAVGYSAPVGPQAAGQAAAARPAGEAGLARRSAPPVRSNWRAREPTSKLAIGDAGRAGALAAAAAQAVVQMAVADARSGRSSRPPGPSCRRCGLAGTRLRSRPGGRWGSAAGTARIARIGRPAPARTRCERASGAGISGMADANTRILKDLRAPGPSVYHSASYFPRFSLEPVMKAMTVSAKPETVKHDWYVVDATGKTLGRLCSELARRLRGKHKPDLHPARRHRRLPRRGQRREDRGHRQQADTTRCITGSPATSAT